MLGVVLEAKALDVVVPMAPQDNLKCNGTARGMRGWRMTGSALSKYLQVRAARNVSCGEKEMILRRIGGGPGGGWARDRASTEGWADL